MLNFRGGVNGGKPFFELRITHDFHTFALLKTGRSGGMMPPLRKPLIISGFAKGRLSGCKRWSFSVQLTAFWKAKDGQWKTHRQTSRHPSASHLTPTPTLPKGGSLLCLVAVVGYLAHSVYQARWFYESASRVIVPGNIRADCLINLVHPQFGCIGIRGNRASKRSNYA